MTKLIRKAQYGMFWNPPSSWGLDLDDESDLQNDSIGSPIRGNFQYTNISDLFNRLKGNPIDLSSLALGAAAPTAGAGSSTDVSLNTQSQVEPQNTSNNTSSGGSTNLPPAGTGTSGKKLADGKYPYANTKPYKGIKT